MKKLRSQFRDHKLWPFCSSCVPFYFQQLKFNPWSNHWASSQTEKVIKFTYITKSLIDDHISGTILRNKSYHTVKLLMAQDSGHDLVLNLYCRDEFSKNPFLVPTWTDYWVRPDLIRTTDSGVLTFKKSGKTNLFCKWKSKLRIGLIVNHPSIRIV